jgi:transposase-like protein
MPRQYLSGFRDELVQRMVTGEPVLSFRDDTGVPEQTLHRWKHQGLIDAGVKDGVDSCESAALLAANKRIKALEKELQLVKDASEISDSLVVDPKGERPSRKG